MRKYLVLGRKIVILRILMKIWDEETVQKSVQIRWKIFKFKNSKTEQKTT